MTSRFPQPRLRLLLPLLLPLALAPLFLGGRPLAAQQGGDAAPLSVEEVRGGIYMISGAGGNIAVFLGEDGILLVDGGVAGLADQILETVDSLAEEAGANRGIRYLVNTHWHFDHTGSNEGYAWAGATLVAHEGVLRALSETRVLEALDGRQVQPLPPAGRPALTFNDRMNLALNGELLHLVHMPSAHSDGDLIVHFRDADVMHLGDLYFNGLYPYIDVDHGGNLQGMVGAIQEVVTHARESAVFIPGHGPLATLNDLQSYLDMLRTVSERVGQMVVEGKSREEVISAHPTTEFDPVWGQGGGFTEPDLWVGLVYDGFIRAGSGGNPAPR